MSSAKIEIALLPIVRRYGFEQVHQSLHEVEIAERQCAKYKQDKPSPYGEMITKSTKKEAKPTALEYVLKMQIPSEKEFALVEIAGRFEDKSFLPTYGEISNFCQMYGIDEPASKTRANVIPRIFKFIATMEPEDIQRILNDGTFSGPSRLGPIADAIRNNGRAGRPTYN